MQVFNLQLVASDEAPQKSLGTVNVSKKVGLKEHGHIRLDGSSVLNCTGHNAEYIIIAVDRDDLVITVKPAQPRRRAPEVHERGHAGHQQPPRSIR